MRVKKEVRKQATLYMLYNRSGRSDGGERVEFTATAYTVASWHWLAQPPTWHHLQGLVKSRFVRRVKLSIYPDKVYYQLTKSGRKYVDNHYLECKLASWAVVDWKLAKYKRGLLS